MTEQEAIEVIKRLNFCGLCTTGPCGNCKRKLAKDVALSALEEIKEYRKVGTVEECQAAQEKQKAKKLLDPLIYLASGTCPVCYAQQFNHDVYCRECGQKLDWEYN